MDTVKISLSLEYNPISKQLEEQNIKFDKEKIAKAQKYQDMINELRIAGILTDKLTLNPVRKCYKQLKPIIIEAIIL